MIYAYINEKYIWPNREVYVSKAHRLTFKDKNNIKTQK